MLRKSNRPYTDRTPRVRWQGALARFNARSLGWPLSYLPVGVELPELPEPFEATAETEDNFFSDIGESSIANSAFRRVEYTGNNMQLVLMSLKPGEEIGLEVHESTSQFLRIEQGSGKLTLGEETHEMQAESAVVVPEGTSHNLVNTGTADMKLYSIYSPPQHPEETVHETKEEADAAEDHEVEAGVLASPEDITISDILEAHDRWQEESPDDPNGIHDFVDKTWAEKRAKKVDVG